MFTPQGKFAWYELMTTDSAVAGPFYSSVLGWSTHVMPSATGSDYTTFNIGDVGIAGMITIPEHNSWIGYIHVPDVDAHIEKILEAGGNLLKPATDVPGMLRFAVVSDPQGAAFIVFTANPAMGEPQRPQSPTPGTPGWHELYTSDLEAGFAFYQSLFGWSLVRDIDMGPMGPYRIYDDGSKAPMGSGGIMTRPPHVPVSAWGFYFNVDSISAAIQRIQHAGGKVLNGPQQVPGGSWVINAQDPLGATFSLVSTRE